MATLVKLSDSQFMVVNHDSYWRTRCALWQLFIGRPVAADNNRYPYYSIFNVKLV
jgi:hypothetical protein